MCRSFKALRPKNCSNKFGEKQSWPFLTNIHGCFHEALLPGGKFSEQLLLSLSRPLTSESKNKWHRIWWKYSNVTTAQYLTWVRHKRNTNRVNYWIKIFLSHRTSTSETVLKDLSNFLGIKWLFSSSIIIFSISQLVVQSFKKVCKFWKISVFFNSQRNPKKFCLLSWKRKETKKIFTLKRLESDIFYQFYYN